MAELVVKDVHTYYGDSHVLHGLSLEVAECGVVSVLGRNGVGKTTLIRSIMGFLRPRQGSITFDGQEITCLRPFQINSLGIGVVPQGRRVFRSLSTKENLDVAFHEHREMRWSMDRVLTLFPRLADRLRTHAGQLSGGEQQMLAIARALVGNPSFLLLDEPTEGLSPLLVEELGRIIRELKGDHLSTLLVEQNVHFAVEVVEYVYVMSRGTIAHQCHAPDLLDNAEVMSKYLGV